MILHLGKILEKTIPAFKSFTTHGGIGAVEYTVLCPTVSKEPVNCKVLTLTGIIPDYAKGVAVYITESSTDYVIIGTPYLGALNTEFETFRASVEKELSELRVALNSLTMKRGG
jgi:hypothetical protein